MPDDDEKLLWNQYFNDPNIENRNLLVMHYNNLVQIVVSKIFGCYNNYVERDDLMAYGMIGLIYAIEKFDLSKGIKFETYASIRIRGYIIDEIRKQDILPTSLRRRIKHIEDVYAELEGKLNRQPEDSEVAEKLGISVGKLRKIFEQSYLSNIVSFDDCLFDTATEPKAGDKYSPEKVMEKKFLKEYLEEEIQKLNEKDKLVLSLYYNEGLTLKEIGYVIGVSESRVSQIHSKVLMLLKSRLGKILV